MRHYSAIFTKFELSITGIKSYLERLIHKHRQNSKKDKLSNTSDLVKQPKELLQFLINQFPLLIINLVPINSGSNQSSGTGKNTTGSSNNFNYSSSSNSDNYGWADTSQINQQREAGARNDARVAAFDAKIERMENLFCKDV